jgi:hypothetical protein
MHKNHSNYVNLSRNEYWNGFGAFHIFIIIHIFAFNFHHRINFTHFQFLKFTNLNIHKKYVQFSKKYIWQ